MFAAPVKSSYLLLAAPVMVDAAMEKEEMKKKAKGPSASSLGGSSCFVENQIFHKWRFGGVAVGAAP